MTPVRQALALMAWGAALVLPACAQPDAGGSGAPAATGQAASPRVEGCNAGAAQDALGQPVTDALAEQARQRAGARTVRVIAHDQMVTKEYNASRLNLELDEQRQVVRIYCG